MNLLAALFEVGYVSAILGGWVLYFRERARSRDYVADLLAVVYRYGLGKGDLRRSLEWREVEQQVERWERVEERCAEEIEHAVTCEECGGETYEFERDCRVCGTNRWSDE